MLRPLEGVDAAHAADTLIVHFGSLRATLAASAEEQQRAIGDRRVVRYLGVLRRSIRWTLREAVENKTFLTSTEALRKYLRFTLGSGRFEQLRVFYLNAAGALISEECFDRGASDHVTISVAQIIKRGLNLDARFLLMTHNHSSGDPAPSRDDIDMTRRVAVAANSVGLTLYDHLIVAEARDFSFRENGRL
jgi:DNA repair protein RadC